MIRSTRQRKAIFEVIQKESRPMTVTEIHLLAKQSAPRVGLRTVYRNIRELVDDGKLVCVDYPGQPPRYETVGNKTSSKPHLICGRCNKVFDLDAQYEARTTHGDIPGFVIDGTETIYYGHCSDPEHCPHRVK
jgi:Fur family transcriptional regulator, ferric uptake regulator